MRGEVSAEAFDFATEYEYLTEYERENPKEPSRWKYYVHLTFETPVVCHSGVTLIGSRMDTDIHLNTCRLSFYGTILHCPPTSASSSSSSSSSVSLSANLWPINLKLMTTKMRKGRVDRVSDDHLLIGTDLFKKETDITKFDGMKVRLLFGERVLLGKIEGSFGKTGKFKVRVSEGGLVGLWEKRKGGEGEKEKEEEKEDFGVIVLEFRKMMRMKDHKMYQ